MNKSYTKADLSKHDNNSSTNKKIKEEENNNQKNKEDHIATSIEKTSILVVEKPTVKEEKKVEEKPEVKPVPTKPKIDYNEILSEKWPNFSKFFNNIDNIKNILISKRYLKPSINNLITYLQKEIIEIENKIAKLKEKNTNGELNKEQAAFVLTRGAIKAIELLNENLYNKIFIDGNVPNEDILLSYRIFFQLFNKSDFVNIKDNNEFWKKTCEFFVNESNGKTGTMIQNMIKQIDFSNENIMKLQKISQGSIHKMTPTYFSKICGTTGLIIFLIKDAFEYSAIIVDKKTSQTRLLQNYNYGAEVLQKKIERLKNIQSKYSI